jgi:hypothetical protein
MCASLRGLKYRSLSLTLHCYMVSLFAIQSLLCFSDLSAHSCVSLQLRCKCSVYLGLFMMIIALIVSQA